MVTTSNFDTFGDTLCPGVMQILAMRPFHFLFQYVDVTEIMSFLQHQNLITFQTRFPNQNHPPNKKKLISNLVSNSKSRNQNTFQQTQIMGPVQQPGIPDLTQVLSSKGGLSIDRSGLHAFASSLSAQIDTTWIGKSARASRLFQHDLIGKHATDDEWEHFGLGSLQGTVELLGVDSRAYDWKACVAAICEHFGVAMAAVAAVAMAMPEPVEDGVGGVNGDNGNNILAAAAAEPANQGVCTQRSERDAIIKDLQATIKRQAKTIANLKSSNAGLRAKRERYRSCATRATRVKIVLKKNLKNEREEATKSKMYKGKAQRYFMHQAAFELVCRRNALGVAAKTMGLAAAVDIHGKTLTKYEIHMRAAKISAYRNFAKLVEAKLVEHSQSDEEGFMWRIMPVAGDATNAKVWQESKIHVVEAAI